ncbi:MAG: Trk system potassium transporter TrkA [Alphaproteobacteria bacterium]
MRVIICGAGQIGASIAAYLSDEDNDVTVIDIDSDRLSHINNSLDVNTVHGLPSAPDTLKSAGADECDLIIAVTGQDEINMVACQVSHSLFGVPKKIARVRNQSYLDPAWSNLFSRAHMPIDVIVSPESLISEDIFQRLSIPGTTTAINLGKGNAHLVGVICMDDCPVLHTPLGQLNKLFPDLAFCVVSLTRGTKTIMPDDAEMLEVNDEVYIIVDTLHLRRVMAAFGHLEKEARKIIISGGGNIGISLVRKLQENVSGLQVKIIEHNDSRAQYLSEQLANIIILNGDTLERSIMEEAAVSTAETYIALMNDDESNILGSLLAKQYGCERVVTLVNNNAYFPLVGPLGIDTMISPKSVIVSQIMRHVRRGRIISIHSIHGGDTEVTEIEISDSSRMANKTIKDLELPTNVVIGALIRDDRVIISSENEKVLPKDHLIVLSPRDKAKEMERLLSVHVDLL